MDKNKIIGLLVIAGGGYLLYKELSTGTTQEDQGFSGGGTIETIDSSGGTPSATGGADTYQTIYNYNFPETGSASDMNSISGTENLKTANAQGSGTTTTTATPKYTLTPTQKLIVTTPSGFASTKDMQGYYNQVDKNGNYRYREGAPSTTSTKKATSTDQGWLNQVDKSGNFINRGTSPAIQNSATSKKTANATPAPSIANNNINNILNKLGLTKKGVK